MQATLYLTPKRLDSKGKKFHLPNHKNTEEFQGDFGVFFLEGIKKHEKHRPALVYYFWDENRIKPMHPSFLVYARAPGTDSKAQKRSPARRLEDELGTPKPPRGAVRLSPCSPPLKAGGGQLQVRGPQLHCKRSLLTSPVFSPATTHRCFLLWEGGWPTFQRGT